MDKCFKCRKAGTKLFLKGERCNTAKCALTRRNYQPGAHGGKRVNTRKSEYGLQLTEKQKAKSEYIMRERQFSNLFSKAARSRENTGEELLRLLELRFDNVLYRLGWAPSRLAARQLITHRKIKLNNKVINIPSITLKEKDTIAPVENANLKPQKVTLPKWLKADAKGALGEVVAKPSAEEIGSDIDTQLIIEFYSR